MLRKILFVFVAVFAGLIAHGDRAAAAAQRPSPPAAAGEVPVFEVDPGWLKVPNNWILGRVSDVYADSEDRVWVLQRPRTVAPDQQKHAAPAVLQFHANGTFIQGWGGPGDGYEWPDIEHGIYVDHKGLVWIGGNGEKDNQVLKFTSAGAFVMQIGRRGQSQGNSDTRNVNRAADVFVHAPTNELFVADGYGNRRVIVFDADTGVFKRMWGAFGNAPADPRPGEVLFGADEDTSQGPAQFNNPHSVRVSNDGLVYVCDRNNQRLQVFRTDGSFVTQVFLSRGRMPVSTASGTAFGRPLADVENELRKDPSGPSRTAFSPDPDQRFLYVIDRRFQMIRVLDRRTLTVLGSVGGGAGEAPGQFYILHSIAADGRGNLYTAEVTPAIRTEGRNDDGNRRAQKLTFKGFAPRATAQGSGTVQEQLSESYRGSQRNNVEYQKVAPIKIFDNLVYVGPGYVSAWLVPTSDGLILIDTAEEPYVDHVIGNIRKAGFDPRDIKYIVISQGHLDHFGGAARIQELSGAHVVALAEDWDLIEAAGKAPATPNLPAVRVPKRDTVVKDGDTLTLGTTTFKLFKTSGHTPGTLSSEFTVYDNGRPHKAFMMGGSGPRGGLQAAMELVESADRIARMPGIEVSIQTHSWLNSEPYPGGGVFERALKLAQRRPGDPHPFVDPTSWQQWIRQVQVGAAMNLQEQKQKAAQGQR